MRAGITSALMSAKRTRDLRSKPVVAGIPILAVDQERAGP
jgi:hypothetical protein